MKDADYILKWTEDLKTEIKALPFPKDDIRKDFFGLIYDIAYCHYRGFILFEFSDFINKGQIAFNSEIDDYKIHIHRVAETVKDPILTAGYLNSLNRSLLIDSWSTYELCVTTFCEGLSTVEEKDKLLKYQYNDLTRQIKSVELSEKEDGEIRKLTVKNHLTHVPITRKTDFLFKKSNGYSRNQNQDKEFLRFFGKFRNTQHTNFIYYGNDYEFKFEHSHFVFRDTKLVKWTDPFSPSPNLYFYLIHELKEIWKELIRTIEHKDLIQYPDNDQE